jgi:hypothetical protein
MFDFNEFKLVALPENEQLYNCQSELIDQITCDNFAETTLKIAILLTLPPVSDNSEAIKLLKAGFEETNDRRFAIVGSFLASEWEIYKKNDFVSMLNSFLCEADDEQKAIIYYLNAYDIFMRNEIIEKRDTYIALLNKSLSLNKKFVYNYYRLAQVSEKEKAKELAEKALSNIETVFSDEECADLEINDFISYEAFLGEHILGTSLSKQNFQEIESFYKTAG